MGAYIGNPEAMVLKGLNNHTELNCTMRMFFEFVRLEFGVSLVGFGKYGYWIFDVATFTKYTGNALITPNGKDVINIGRFIALMEYGIIEELCHALGERHTQEQDWIDLFLDVEVDI